MNFSPPRCDGKSLLPHHAGRKPRLPSRRLDLFFQETMRFLPGISGARVGPGTALVVGRTGRLAGIVALASLKIETLVVAAGTVDRGFDRAVSWLDDTGAAHAGDAAIILGAFRHTVLEPANRAGDDIARIVEAPGPATAVSPAYQRAIGGIA